MSTRPRNDTFLRALLRQPVDHTPVWVMRQAGRYLPEYNQTRARAGGFMDLCRSPALATEVTLQPLGRFRLDAAILFSDILTIPDAMGLGLYFAEGEGPRFERPLREEWEIRDLQAPDPQEHLGYVLEAVSEIRRALAGEVPLIGFSGSPFTLACYMIDGAGGGNFERTRAMLYSRPDLLHRVLQVNCEAVTRYLNAQIQAGAQAVMVFDTWGGLLSGPAFREFSLAYLEQVLAGLIRVQDGEVVPRVVFTKGGAQWLEGLASIGADALGLDWTCDLGLARGRVGQQVALQGNLDPAVLLSNPEEVKRQVARVLADFGHGTGHVFNLGHGVSQHTPPENVAALVEAVLELSPAYHRPLAD